MDDDDYIDHSMVEDTVKAMINTEADMIAFNMQLVYDGKKGQVFGWKDNKVSTRQIKDKILCIDSWEIWSKAYRKSLWKEVRFPLNISGCEDLYVMPHVLSLAEKITVLPPVYYYFEKSDHGSISQNPTSKEFYCGFLAWEEHIKYMDSEQKLMQYRQLQIYKNFKIQFALFALLYDDHKNLSEKQSEKLKTFLDHVGINDWKRNKSKLLVTYYCYHTLAQQENIRTTSRSIPYKAQKNLLKKAMKIYVMNQVDPVLNE